MEREPQSSERIDLPKPELKRESEATQSPERAAEHPDERHERVEAARAVIEKHGDEPTAAERPDAPKPKTILTGLDLDRAYRDTLRSLQRHLNAPSRTFSRVIHNPTVERTSEVVGATVARPSVTLGATLTALLVGGGAYITAKRYGFPLSGSELIISLIVGGIAGGLIELVARKLRRPQP